MLRLGPETVRLVSEVRNILFGVLVIRSGLPVSSLELVRFMTTQVLQCLAEVQGIECLSVVV